MFGQKNWPRIDSFHERTGGYKVFFFFFFLKLKKTLEPRFFNNTSFFFKICPPRHGSEGICHAQFLYPEGICSKFILFAALVLCIALVVLHVLGFVFLCLLDTIPLHFTIGEGVWSYFECVELL